MPLGDQASYDPHPAYVSQPRTVLYRYLVVLGLVTVHYSFMIMYCVQQFPGATCVATYVAHIHRFIGLLRWLKDT